MECLRLSQPSMAERVASCLRCRGGTTQGDGPKPDHGREAAGTPGCSGAGGSRGRRAAPPRARRGSGARADPPAAPCETSHGKLRETLPHAPREDARSERPTGRCGSHRCHAGGRLTAARGSRPWPSRSNRGTAIRPTGRWWGWWGVTRSCPVAPCSDWPLRWVCRQPARPGGVARCGTPAAPPTPAGHLGPPRCGPPGAAVATPPRNGRRLYPLGSAPRGRHRSGGDTAPHAETGGGEREARQAGSPRGARMGEAPHDWTRDVRPDAKAWRWPQGRSSPVGWRGAPSARARRRLRPRRKGRPSPTPILPCRSWVTSSRAP